MNAGRLIYYLGWVRARLAGRRIPLSSSIILTERCNLNCCHCTVANLGNPEPRFDSVAADLATLYATGARVLVIAGGEPFMWRDNGRGLEDVVQLAHGLGFFRVVVCTNGTFPLESSADYLWVSLDGSPGEHEELRGGVYSRVVGNMRRSRHPGLSVNFTVSRLNWRDFERAARPLLRGPRLRGVLFHLFTPYVGSDPDLRLTPAQRRQVVSGIRRLKQQYPLRVTNTFDGIRALASGRWARPVWGSIVANRGDITTCCCRAGIADADVCAGCGCTPAVETFVLQQVGPLALLENLRYV
jgi:MoaA/NifB/PqqE/SkfB family radical SAM enzyme